jgi:hypothetical protein
MKKIALLLLALPLAACATAAPTPQKNAQAAYVPPNSLIARPYSQGPIPAQTLQYIAEAETHCRAGNLGPSDPKYGPCVNDYLQDHYGLAIFVDSAGALRVAIHERSEPTVQFGGQPL